MSGSASANGWKKSDFVTGAERGIPRGEFLIARGDQRAAKFLEPGIASGDALEKIFDGGGIRDIDGILRAADKLFDLAEEENVYMNGLGDSWHKGIVTCGETGG